MHNLRKKREKIHHESSLFLIFGYLLKVPLNARKRCLRQHLFLHGVELRRGIALYTVGCGSHRVQSENTM